MKTKFVRVTEIENMREDFYRAYYNTSFTPDVRAEQCVRDFSAELEADLVELGDKTGNYAEKYVAHLRTWADADTVPRKIGELRKRAERLRLDAINRKVEPWCIIHAVTVICLGIILIIAFGAVCFDAIGGLM